MTIEIRKAIDADVTALKDISRRTIDTCHRFLGDEAVDWFIDGPSDEYVDEQFSHTDVMLHNGKVIGYSVCKDNLIDLMMIDCALHRQGYGSQLLKYCELALFEKYDEIVLESFEDNEQASCFYRKNAWLEEKRFLDSGGTGFRKILFKKKKACR